MMEYSDIACILFVCVTMNHLGLISAIEDVIGARLPIVNCPKCATFWFTLAYGLWAGGFPLQVLAISFFSSYLALWLELGMGMTDYFYRKLYGKIYSEANDTASADTCDGDTAGTVSDLQ